MHQRKRFYTAGHGLDDNAVARIIQKAIELKHEIPTVSRIVFLARELINFGWLERQYGYDSINKLRKGAQLPDSNVLAKFDSLKTYSSAGNEIVIALGLKSDEILKLDDEFEIAAILAMPWLEDDAIKWARITNAINIDDNVQAEIIPNPPCEVIKAFSDLTGSINKTTGIVHPSDERLAKTYLRALHKYGFILDADEIESYLIRPLNWKKRHADQLLEIVNKINNGKSFQGGDRTGLQNYIKKWQRECNEQR